MTAANPEAGNQAPAEPAAPETTVAPASPVAPATTPPETWRDALGEELKVHPVLGQFKDEDFVSVPRQLVRSHIEQQRFLGLEKMPVPQENWTEADYAEHYKRLGRPETVEGYELAAPELPEGYPRVEDDEQALVAAMFDAGLTKTQAQQLHKRFYEVNGNRYNAYLETAARTNEDRGRELEESWGASYQANLQLANQAFHKYGGTREDIEALRLLPLKDGTLLGSYSGFLQLLSNVGQTLKEHELLESEGPVRDFGMSPEQAKAEYTKLEIRFFSMDKTDPEYASVRDRMNQLAPLAFSRAGEGTG